MNDYRFGNFVCTLREKKGMTQADLANLLGVTPAAVSKWENGISKPRVEVLFRLAELLDVRPEELVAGQYLESPEASQDSIAFQQINDRYEYLQRVEPFNATGVKFKRLLSWILDWWIIFFAGIFLVSVLSAIGSPQALVAAGILIIPVCFVLRDAIFGKRSLGKRITKLVVLDIQTGRQARWWQFCVRNLLLFFVFVDGIVMLASGRSLGDRLAHTAVIPKHVVDSDGTKNPQPILFPPIKHKTPKWIIALIIGGLVLFVALSITSALTALNTFKNTEEAQIARTYLAESEAFRSLGATVEDITMTRFKSTTKRAADGTTATVAEIGFSVKGKSFTVICHQEDGKWYVCPSCTVFS